MGKLSNSVLSKIALASTSGAGVGDALVSTGGGYGIAPGSVKLLIDANMVGLSQPTISLSNNYNTFIVDVIGLYTNADATSVSLLPVYNNGANAELLTRSLHHVGTTPTYTSSGGQSLITCASAALERGAVRVFISRGKSGYDTFTYQWEASRSGFGGATVTTPAANSTSAVLTGITLVNPAGTITSGRVRVRGLA